MRDDTVQITLLRLNHRLSTVFSKPIISPFLAIYLLFYFRGQKLPRFTIYLSHVAKVLPELWQKKIEPIYCVRGCNILLYIQGVLK
jgi:hypothetical protein